MNVKLLLRKVLLHLHRDVNALDANAKPRVHAIREPKLAMSKEETKQTRSTDTQTGGQGEMGEEAQAKAMGQQLTKTPFSSLTTPATPTTPTTPTTACWAHGTLEL